ncbi:hypothetical protein [Mucilaginibacter pedocola]|uniref:Uncharacterized protein n=1 Tax=Mucilaginibacter pedocola TaxID=1792845 RepID=A0A1S9PD07_9SPHI|nr:hypothetical protein [Mucilaginibacter pedocola]OOQ58866.1 hypothetical protein BC343_09490 [Mucilaginibacter pedocola]
MKALKILLLACCILAVKTNFAQTLQAIEADLLKSFKKIEYWDQKQRGGDADASDSLEAANDRFGKKLQTYTHKYPSTIASPFELLKKENLDIATSADGLFRIYSWDDLTGGTQRYFANVMQYKTGNKTRSVLLSDSSAGTYYTTIYTLKAVNKTYYLGIYGFIESSKYAGTGVKVFAIENGSLNNKIKLLKTTSGLRNEISYEYDFGSVVNIPFEERPTITFDSITQTIKIPLVTKDGNVTKKFITYKFTGQYFEKVVSK